ncbi:MAG: hypothetical protein J5856_00990 [Lachnospiraceae bacterium]|nr:hypothetical protein [Lachnospiraceae bacterium]
MKKKFDVTRITTMVIAGAAIVFIILSMCVEKANPFLNIGLGLVALSNIVCWILNGIRKGKNNGSAESRSIS